MKDLDRTLQSALTCSEEELKLLVHHPFMKLISNLLCNSNLTENLALIIANRRDISPEILESIYSDRRWRGIYRLMLALCKNPRTPSKISLSLLKTLKIFDLGDLTRNQQIPINVRTAAESHINEKMLSIPLGIKMALARRVGVNVLIRLMEDGMQEVVTICLNSPYMTEGILCKVINAKKTSTHVIRQIAGHPKWSLRYDVQWSLIRNSHTPLARVADFLKKIKTNQLSELYADPGVPSSTKPFIYRELMDRQGTAYDPTH